MTRAPLLRFAEKAPSGSQTQPQAQTATIQAHPITGTLAKPSGSQIQAPSQAQPQAPAQAQTQPPAPAQPPKLVPAYFPQRQAAPTWGARRLQNLYMMKTGLGIFQRARPPFIAKQAHSELLDRVANFCELERGETEDQRKVMRMNRPAYHDLARASINLALSWHSVAEEKTDLNFNIVTGKLNKRMKSCTPPRPWGPEDFYSGVGYHIHNLECYTPKPESLVIPSKPPPAEQKVEDQPFCLFHKHPDDPCE